MLNCVNPLYIFDLWSYEWSLLYNDYIPRLKMYVFAFQSLKVSQLSFAVESDKIIGMKIYCV